MKYIAKMGLIWSQIQLSNFRWRPVGGAYDDPPDPLIVRGFTPSTLATHYFSSILPRFKLIPGYGCIHKSVYDS